MSVMSEGSTTRPAASRRLPGDTPGLQATQGQGLLPLSFSQERLWFLDRYNPGSPLYNLPAYLPIPGDAPEETVKAALDLVAARHQPIKARFVAVDGKPFQEHLPDAEIPFEVVEVPRDLADAAFNDVLSAALKEVGDALFDLDSGPMMRARLIRRGDRDAWFVYCMHHIVSDGWSVGVFQREFTTAYRALQAGVRPELPRLPISFAEYAARQQRAFSGERVSARLDAWKQRLSGDDLVLPLPLDKPRPAHLTFTGATQSFALDAEASRRLAEFARSAGVTPFMLFLAAFKVLLFRYTHKGRVIVGCPTAARTTTDVEPLIGFFVNSLVMVTDLDAAMSFRAAVAAVRETTLDALGSEDLPFEKIVEAVQPIRSANINPIFQAMFDFQGTTIAADAPRYADPPKSVNTSTSKFDLTLQMQAMGDRFAGTFEYSTELFEHDTIKRLHEGFCAMLEGAAADPDAAIGRLPVMTPAIRDLVVRGFNDTAREVPFISLPERFEQMVARDPDAPAARCLGIGTSYGELNARANRFARLLLDADLGRGAVVALCMDGSLELVVAMLGILKAGHAYLALDPRYPDGRIAYMLEDSGAAMVVTQSDLAPRFATMTVPAREKVLVFDRGEDPATGFSDDPPGLALHPRTLAYVIYTSGSTGRPKGVMIEHASVINLIEGTVAALDLGPGDRILQFSSFGFDVSVREIFEALLSGGEIVLAPRADLPAGEELFDLLERERITSITLPPSLWSSLRARSLPDLTSAVSGGAALPESVVAKWGGARAFFNAYGPTETTVGTTMGRCRPGAGKPTIGGPLPNYRHYVVDAGFELCPIGVAGELLIGGKGVGRGYMGRPDLTAERFLPDFLGEEPGGRLYRTGDLARILPNGEVDYLGRADDQIELRGFRIEPAEIEEVVKEHPDVVNVTVQCVVGGNGEKRLVAYVAARGALSGDAVIAHARGLLPDYMIPAQVVLIDDVPLTPAGKVDRARLPDADETLMAAIAEGARVLPQDRLERLAHWIWSMVLGTDAFGVTDNFFALGGHSLLVTQVTSRIGEQLDIDVPIRLMFEAPTVRAFCKGLRERAEDIDARLDRLDLPAGDAVSGPDGAQPEEARAAPLARGFDRVARRPEGLSPPLSFAQERLWFLDRFAPRGNAYNGLVSLMLPAPVEPRLAERAINSVVARHEVLRTVFAVEGGLPVQRVTPRLRLSLDLFEFPDAASAADSDAIRVLILEQARRPFDLREGPLVRAVLAIAGDRSGCVILPIHHAVCDAWSTGILQHEIGETYRALQSREKPNLPPLEVQYGDFALWQRTRLDGERLARLSDFWRSALADAPSLIDLPLDRPRGPARAPEGRLVGFAVAPDVHAALADLGNVTGATTFMVYLAAFAAWLRRLSGQERVVVGTPMSHRDRPELEPLVGLFTNTLPVCVDGAGEPSFAELVERVKPIVLDVFQNKDLPFEKLVELVHPPRHLSVAPIFQVMFSHQKGLQAISIDAAGMANVAVAGAKFDLTLFVNETPGGVAVVFEYAADVFDPQTVAGFARQFETFLENLAEDPDEIVDRVPLCDTATREAVLHAGIGATAGAPGCLFEMIEDVARRAPSAPALEVEGETIDFAGFLARVGELARGLTALGVRPGDVVAVHLARGRDLALLLAATLRAGATYMNVAPDLPVARRRFMIDDAEAVLVVHGEEATDLAGVEGSGNPAVVSVAALVEAGRGGDLPQTVEGLRHGYLVYTSGTTGMPKGVYVPRRVLDTLIAWQVDEADFAPGLRTLQFSQPGFDVSIQEMLATWASGGTLVVPRPSEIANPGLWPEMLKRTAAGRIFLPYVALQQLAGACSGTDRAGLGLLEVITAGERLVVTPEIRALFSGLAARKGGGAVLVNQYGPSESHVVAAHSLAGDPAVWEETPPIGQPVRGARLQVLDRYLEPVPPGMPGELCIGGSQLAGGYLHAPSRTAERFLPDPHCDPAGPGGRIYATGDLALLRHDGAFVFVGRADDQVKIRGYRVEPSEIEQALTSRVDVGLAFVVPHRFSGDVVELVAYVQPAAGQAAPDPHALDAHLRAILPEFMIPGAFVVIDTIPKTASGKIDKSGLPPPVRLVRRESDHVAPRTALERDIAAVWCEVLGLAAVGVADSFFDLGGQSLLATQVVSRLNETLGLDVPLRRLFETPTIAGIAAALDGGEAAPVAASARRDAVGG
ncbi:amino acid adenylation domain-containing protein [Stappia sp.]|uniref:amino acid adenylation domain-containing protein n=1 Tax=Stappia sp. TaxID=1870903 RepID=UPI003A999215